ncbi:MAG: hypothetical protein WBA74_08765 [Cyclobacteriaceae bacterium]
MKLIDALSLMFSLGFLVIGVDQSVSHGFYNSYWLFMLSLGLMFLYGYRKSKRTETEKTTGSDTKKTKKR